MSERLYPYRLLALTLSIALLLPFVPWTALRAAHGHGQVCHHLACPHQAQRCTCHGHDGTPLWQRCQDTLLLHLDGPFVTYGPLPVCEIPWVPSRVLPHVPETETLLSLRLLTDIFHPPRSL